MEMFALLPLIIISNHEQYKTVWQAGAVRYSLIICEDVMPSRRIRITLYPHRTLVKQALNASSMHLPRH